MPNVQVVPESLKKQLALAVRSIQWSYAIFWSISATQPGYNVLEWGGGYYNGDIKTRKTIQSGEVVNLETLGLERSEQLRQLYETLSACDGTPQRRRHSAALSPEDLTDAEWYYLVCMSFVFNVGQGLPGRTLVSGRPIWLCNAHNTESKVFIRSLLAKSASIQTVACFPFFGGVIELGVSELISEDLTLIQHAKTSFLDILCSVSPDEGYGDMGCEEHDDEFACNVLDPSALDPQVSPLMSCEQGEMISPGKSSDGFEQNELAEDIFLIQRTNDGVSQVQSLQFMDEEFSNCVQHSLTSSDCISEALAKHGKNSGIQRCGTYNNNEQSPMDVEEWKRNKLMDANSNDLPYRTVLAALLKTSDQLVLGPHVGKLNNKSSFRIWKKDDEVNFRIPRDQKPQNVLKKILFEVPQMHDPGLLESVEATDLIKAAWTAEPAELSASHALSEQKRREKISERISSLKSLISSDSKADKISILDDAIKYVQELEKRVRELEACREVIDRDTGTKRKLPETFEQTSDNYGTTRIDDVTQPLINKRKACESVEDEPEIDEIDYEEEVQADIVTVTMNKNNDILIEIMCASREGILLDIMDSVSSLHLDCYSVQSSITEGIMSVMIKSRYKGTGSASSRTIKCSIQKVVWKF